MANQIAPLARLQNTAPVGEPQTDDLVTVNLASLTNPSEFVQAGGRVTRTAYSTCFVRLVGLQVPAGYKLGDTFPLNRDQIVDWAN